MKNKDIILPKLLSPKQVSEILHVSVQTLAIWRTTKRYNLSYYKIGRLVTYKAKDVKNFINASKHKGKI